MKKRRKKGNYIGDIIPNSGFMMTIYDSNRFLIGAGLG